MPDGETKIRIVSFRLSDAEYNAVEARSRRLCFNSVSQFARSLTLAGESCDDISTPLDRDIDRVWRRLELLTAALEKVAVELGLKK
jgi:hypothetical protein